MAMRTITLTDRPPVKIDEAAWPVVASATENWHEGEVECQALRSSKRALICRRNGTRVLVYAVYTCESNWRSEPDASCRRGLLVDGVTEDLQLVSHIRSVGESMDDPAEHDGDTTTWNQMVADCIADLPAESI